MSLSSCPAVDRFTVCFDPLLQNAKELKPSGSLEPLIKYEDLKDGIDVVGSLAVELGVVSSLAIETALHNIFLNFTASIPIEDASFGHVWNLLDIANIVSDLGYTDWGLALKFVEELLEAQTLDGCRIVLTYLESRREFLLEKDFKNKKDLLILRACNDLLRRSSRAEDNAFCGRVFIFLFSSLNFGDKSSVNLRGQFHTENVTTYEQVAVEPLKDEIMAEAEHSSDAAADRQESKVEGGNGQSGDSTVGSDIPTKSVKFESKVERPEEDTPDMDTLYSTFWSLQGYFSQPLTLLDPESISTFQKKLKIVLDKFKDIQQTQLASGAGKPPAELVSGTKRKRNDGESKFASIFNPKYLTSRDLFDLEISDLSFRRHFLVQALILLDFLLSLTPKAKAKTYPPEILSNNSATKYEYSLSEEDTKWASQMKTDIATYLQAGPEGKFYFRMVDTVLSRDKNWTHWKARNCPGIRLDPVTPDQLVEAEKAAAKACAPRRIRQSVLGALDLSFLRTTQDSDDLGKYKDPSRYQLPSLQALKEPIADDEFDIANAKDDTEKRTAEERRASKLWRTLRMASRGRLRAFDQIDDGNDLKPLFEPESTTDANMSEPNTTNGISDVAKEEAPAERLAQGEGVTSTQSLSVEVAAN